MSSQPTTWNVVSFITGVLVTYVALSARQQYISPLTQPAIADYEQKLSFTSGSAGGFVDAAVSQGSQGSGLSIQLIGDDTNSSSSSYERAIQSLRRDLLFHEGSVQQQWRKAYAGFKSRWHPTVLNSVFKAQQMLKSTREARASRFFVPMLSNRHSELCCMLTDLNKKVGGTNALDVFIFTVDNAAENIFKRSECWRRNFNLTVTFMTLDEHWGLDPTTTSSAYHDMKDWSGMPGLFGESYRRMGHWRMTFQFAFADMLGYKYVWQLDDDSYFKSPVTFNMIEYMQEHQLWVAGARTSQDPHFVTWGLPEMARLFLVGERMAPSGPLFSNHTQPAGLNGLYTVRENPVRLAHPLEGDPGGWSRAIIYGNCMIIDMDKFWWPQQHQKFVELVLQTGYHWRFRWNEQGVMAMLWQMFVPDGHYQFDTLPLDYVHPRKTWGKCPDP